MYHPTTRVLAVLELLQSLGRVSGPELAERLRVDRRTLRRYIARLEEMGIPVVTQRGRDGGYALLGGFKMPPLMFNEDEALSLSIGLIAARGLGLAEAAPAVASAQAKLERALPTTIKRRVRALADTVRLDQSSATAPGDNRALIALSSAAQAQQRVQLRYRAVARDGRPEQESRREFDPYGLACRGGCWYVVGYCHLRRDLRSFRLDRVLGVEPVGRSFRRPADFDPLAHLNVSLATLPRIHAVTVLLHADLPSVRRELFTALGVLSAHGDGVLLHAQVDDLDWLARQLAALPFAFRILRPARLRRALRDHAERLHAASNVRCRTEVTTDSA